MFGSIGFESRELDKNCILKASETLHCTDTRFVEREKKGGSTASRKLTASSAAVACPGCLFVYLFGLWILLAFKTEKGVGHSQPKYWWQPGINWTCFD